MPRICRPIWPAAWSGQSWLSGAPGSSAAARHSGMVAAWGSLVAHPAHARTVSRPRAARTIFDTPLAHLTEKDVTKLKHVRMYVTAHSHTASLGQTVWPTPGWQRLISARRRSAEYGCRPRAAP